MNIFISYCRKDEALAFRLQQIVESHRIPCFRDATDIRPGTSIPSSIKAALNRASHLLVIVSDASLQSSWVAYEVGMAEGKHVVILPYVTDPAIVLPLYLSHLNYLKNDDELKDLLANYHIPPPPPFSFVGWSKWGPIDVECAPESPNEVTFNGSFFKTAAGLAIEGILPWQGQSLLLEVSGTKRCTFDQMKLCQVQADGTPLKAEDEHPNYADTSYITARDGIYRFRLPEQMRKMQFVFWNASISDLVFRCQLEDSGC